MSNLVQPFAMLVFCTALTGNVSAQVKFDRLFPTAVSVGTKTTIKAEGKFPTWPVDIYCDRTDVDCEAGSEAGDVIVTIPEGAPHGVAWLRLYDDRSVSKLVPLLIEPLPIEAEVEPNDEPQKPHAVSMPTAISGRLAKAGDVDSFAVDLKRGQTLVATVVAHQILRSPMDTVLQITDMRGNVLAQSDDQHGIDPELVYVSSEDRRLVVRLFAFPETPTSTIGFAGASSFVYLLRLSTGPVCDHCLPLVRNRDSDELRECFGWNLDNETGPRILDATDISPSIAYLPGIPGWQWLADDEAVPSVTHAASIPAVFSGDIAAPGDVDHYVFSATKGSKYRAEVHSREFGFKLDSVLRVLDPMSGKEIAKNDDQSRNQYDAAVEFSTANDGDLQLEISDLADSGSLRHAYSIVLQEVRPSVVLRIPQAQYTLAAGESVELPISIERKHGFSSKLNISADGLPTHIVAEAAVSEPKGDSAGSVKLTLKAASDAPPEHVRFQIEAIEVDREGAPNHYRCEHALRPQVSVATFWLTITASSSK